MSFDSRINLSLNHKGEIKKKNEIQVIFAPIDFEMHANSTDYRKSGACERVEYGRE